MGRVDEPDLISYIAVGLTQEETSVCLRSQTISTLFALFTRLQRTVHSFQLFVATRCQKMYRAVEIHVVVGGILAIRLNRRALKQISNVVGYDNGVRYGRSTTSIKVGCSFTPLATHGNRRHVWTTVSYSASSTRHTGPSCSYRWNDQRLQNAFDKYRGPYHIAQILSIDQCVVTCVKNLRFFQRPYKITQRAAEMRILDFEGDWMSWLPNCGKWI